MIFVIHDIEPISVKWMDIIDLRELTGNVTKLGIDSILCEFYLQHIERTNPADFEAFANDRRRLASSPIKNKLL